MSATTVGPLQHDFRVISLIGVAHGASHYYQLAFATMLLSVRQEAGLRRRRVSPSTGTVPGLFLQAACSLSAAVSPWSRSLIRSPRSPPSPWSQASATRYSIPLTSH